ncbi:MAG: Dabb family protein, partial [Syntrophales bacterium]|nr:Dabb family protein [Syntrophales bacterium]
EIRKYEFGPDILHTERSYDFALVAEYDDSEALKRYQVHPTHIPVLGMVREMSESIVVADFVK